jgi:hypothetical protein
VCSFEKNYRLQDIQLSKIVSSYRATLAMQARRDQKNSVRLRVVS